MSGIRLKVTNAVSKDARCLYLNFTDGALSTVALPAGTEAPYSVSGKAAVGIITAASHDRSWLVVSWNLDSNDPSEHERIVRSYDPLCTVRMLDTLIDLRARWQRTGLSVRCRLFSGNISTLNDIANNAGWLHRLLHPCLASASLRDTPRHLILYVPQ